MMDHLQIVLLSWPYYCWDQIDCAKLFHRMIGLKFLGYSEEYPSGVLPVDGFDFIADHLLICNKSGNELIPISGFKSISSQRCNHHRQSFPLLNILKSSRAEDQAQQVENVLSLTAHSPDASGAVYDYSYTILPAARKDRDLAKLLKSLLTMMHVNYHLTQGHSTVFLTGVNRFKMPELFEFWGYSKVLVNGKQCGSFKQKSLFDEDVTLMMLNEFSKEAKEIAKTFQLLWDKRIQIGDSSGISVDQAAA